MKQFVDTLYFLKQIEGLLWKYRKVKEDYIDFQTSFLITQWVDLGKWFYKFRIKNSSIPVGKRGWFRIIIFAPKDKIQCIPICIYSKTECDDITFWEIFHHFSQIDQERSNH